MDTPSDLEYLAYESDRDMGLESPGLKLGITGEEFRIFYRDRIEEMFR